MSAQLIVVGVDGTSASDAALVYALQDAMARRVPVLAVTAWWVGPVFPDARKPAMDEEQSAASLVQDQAIRRALEAIDGSPEIERRLVHGDAAVALVEAARACSHLVVGCSHKGLYRRVVEGSVSAQCIRNSPVPVTVVPWPPRSTAEVDAELGIMTGGVDATPRPLAGIDA